MYDPYNSAPLQSLAPKGVYAEEQAIFAKMKEVEQKRKSRERWARVRLSVALWIAGRSRHMLKGRPEGRPDWC